MQAQKRLNLKHSKSNGSAPEEEDGILNSDLLVMDIGEAMEEMERRCAQTTLTPSMTSLLTGLGKLAVLFIRAIEFSLSIIFYLF